MLQYQKSKLFHQLNRALLIQSISFSFCLATRRRRRSACYFISKERLVFHFILLLESFFGILRLLGIGIGFMQMRCIWAQQMHCALMESWTNDPPDKKTSNNQPNTRQNLYFFFLKTFQEWLFFLFLLVTAYNISFFSC